MCVCVCACMYIVPYQVQFVNTVQMVRNLLGGRNHIMRQKSSCRKTLTAIKTMEDSLS